MAKQQNNCAQEEAGIGQRLLSERGCQEGLRVQVHTRILPCQWSCEPQCNGFGDDYPRRPQRDR
eukprot:2086483-Amphidinium_carterae.1